MRISPTPAPRGPRAGRRRGSPPRGRPRAPSASTNGTSSSPPPSRRDRQNVLGGQVQHLADPAELGPGDVAHGQADQGEVVVLVVGDLGDVHLGLQRPPAGPRQPCGPRHRRRRSTKRAFCHRYPATVTSEGRPGWGSRNRTAPGANLCLGGVRADLDGQLTADALGPAYAADHHAHQRSSASRKSTRTGRPPEIALTTVRMAVAVRPPRPITRPMSSGWTRTS